MLWKLNWPKCILGALFLFIVAVILFPVFARQRETPSHIPSCQSHLKQIGLGLLQYTQDYDEHLPLVASGGASYGWADATQIYVKSIQIFQCPQETTVGQPNPSQSGYTDYPFDAHLEGKATSAISNLSQQIMLLDGNDGTDVTTARYSLKRTPDEWMRNNTSPLYRHDGLANYLFADGHVKRSKPNELLGSSKFKF